MRHGPKPDRVSGGSREAIAGSNAGARVTKAIKRSEQMEPKSTPRVERVRHTDKGGPDKWRSP